jgi:uncharacterized protein (TIGR03435 family)
LKPSLRLFRLSIPAVLANFVVVCGLLWSQAGTAQQDLAFEAASVKPSSPDQFMTTMQGGPGTSDPGQITYKFINLRNLLSWAYGVGYDAILGPQWLDDARFDVVATMAHGTTKEQWRLMLLHLLEERFKLVAHRETREMPGFALVVAKNGPVLKRASEDSVSGASNELVEQIPVGAAKLDEDGFPVMPAGPGVQERCIEGGCRFKATSASMHELADKLPCRCPIVDETNLTGKYAFVLTGDAAPLSSPDREERAGAPPRKQLFPDIFRALQTQLGLKLERKKVPASLVQIDHIEKVPVEN